MIKRHFQYNISVNKSFDIQISNKKKSPRTILISEKVELFFLNGDRIHRFGRVREVTTTVEFLETNHFSDMTNINLQYWWLLV